MDDLLADIANAATKCQETLASLTSPIDKNGNPLNTYCKGEWDKLSCWPDSQPGPVSINCPAYIPDFNQSAVARRYCMDTGEWYFNTKLNVTWVQYSQCSANIPSENEIVEQLERGDADLQRLMTLYTVGYSFTLISVTLAMIILAYFPKLHCTRNYIHMHLFASFMLRAIIVFIKDKTVLVGSGIFDLRNSSINHELPGDLIGEANTLNSTYEMQSRIDCKIVMALFHYFIATNYYWVFVEALHLHRLIYITVLAQKIYMWKYILIGWGAPVSFVVSWAIVRATLGDSDCWDVIIPGYAWIYNGPIVFVNLVNFLLFLNTIRVLWYKTREWSALSGAEARKRNRHRKLAKSTLVLVFMFGVHSIVFIWFPNSINDGWLWYLRMYFDLFFNSFQGFFVAIICCFCDDEVQAEIKRAWHRFNLSAEMQRRNTKETQLSTGKHLSPSGSTQSPGWVGNRSNSHALNSQNHDCVCAGLTNVRETAQL